MYKNFLKSVVGLILALLTSSAISADFWRCQSEDEAERIWKVDDVYQKRAINAAYAFCKKQSKYPKSCHVAKTGCQFFANGVNTDQLWVCSALDKLSQLWPSNPYPNRNDAVVAAREYCQQKSQASDSCYVNLLTCKSIEHVSQ